MGMKVAQQYPDVYDGIMGAAPALNWTEFYINSFWPSFYMENTQQFPRDCELNALTALGIAACDSLDGVKDGLISDPEACRVAFDPFSHVGDSFFCSTTNTTLAITQAAAAVANASWTGPRFSNGKFLYDGYEIGSDLSVIAPTNCTGEVCTSAGRANILFPWQAFVMKDPSATLPNITDGTFDTIYRAVKLAFASNMETDEADLRDFRDAGGKLMTYHGLVSCLSVIFCPYICGDTDCFRPIKASLREAHFATTTRSQTSSGMSPRSTSTTACPALNTAGEVTAANPSRCFPSFELGLRMALNLNSRRLL